MTEKNEMYTEAMSWTSNIDIAYDFATRFESHGKVWEIQAKKDWVLAINGGHEENEFIMDLPEGVKRKVLQVPSNFVEQNKEDMKRYTHWESIKL